MIKIIACSIIMILSISLNGTIQAQVPIFVAKTANEKVKQKGFNYKKHYKKQKRHERKNSRKGVRCSWMEPKYYNYKKSL